jgi:branched-chain amino acid transport system permease protein
MAAASLYTVAAYFLYALNIRMGLLPSFLVAVMLTSILSLLIEWTIYRPFYHKKASPNVIMIASLGVMTIILNVLAIVFNGESKMIDSVPSLMPFSKWGINLTGGKVLIIKFASMIVLAFLLVKLLMRLFHCNSQFILKISALSDNPELFEIHGFSINATRNLIFVLSGVFLAVSSCLSAYSFGFNLQAGMPALINAMVAIIIGGFGRHLWSCVFGGMSLGILQSLSMFLVPKEWVDVITFMVLLTFLFFRPQGIMGHKKRLA